MGVPVSGGLVLDRGACRRRSLVHGTQYRIGCPVNYQVGSGFVAIVRDAVDGCVVYFTNLANLHVPGLAANANDNVIVGDNRHMNSVAMLQGKDEIDVRHNCSAADNFAKRIRIK